MMFSSDMVTIAFSSNNRTLSAPTPVLVGQSPHIAERSQGRLHAKDEDNVPLFLIKLITLLSMRWTLPTLPSGGLHAVSILMAHVDYMFGSDSIVDFCGQKSREVVITMCTTQLPSRDK